MCGGLRPTLLHVDLKQKTAMNAAMPSESTFCTDTLAHSVDVNEHSTQQYNSMILPVVLYHKDNTSKRIKVYAILDDQSNSDHIFVSGSSGSASDI